MIFDAENLFSNAQAVTASAASTNIVDFGARGTPEGAPAAIVRDMSKGEPIECVGVVTTTATSGGSATLLMSFQTDNDVAFGSPRTVWVAPAAIAVASLVEGYDLQLPTQLPNPANERYCRWYYTVATADLTAGKFKIGFVAAKQTNNAT
jgi:hypothetical protein